MPQHSYDAFDREDENILSRGRLLTELFQNRKCPDKNVRATQSGIAALSCLVFDLDAKRLQKLKILIADF